MGRAKLGGVLVGDGAPVGVIGALNVSPESFYAGSVHRDLDDLVRAGEGMVAAGAVAVDVGARSTAPYLETAISDGEEAGRLASAVARLAAVLPVPVSADTAREGAARAALDAGARIVNDVTALADAGMARLVAERGAGLIMMAAPGAPPLRPDPLDTVAALLEAGLARARRAGVPDEHVVLDPGIGFFREAEGLAWHEWDCRVLAGLEGLAALGRPLCVGVSRKSFLGAVTGRGAVEARLAASLAATAVAVWNGAALIRTHDVAETLDAVRVAERLAETRRR
ncbi:MAG: dihydropteroate synthase [Candidatus Rokubacteria bacterium]|nr:dihydropteroate synthase [Candidatus Rokubacteria bacterium]MBI3824492.1 dihydropteroate synthase [Candidatus Rokubacteria bacterium]